MKGQFPHLVWAGFCAVLVAGGCGETDSEIATCAPGALASPILEEPEMWAVVDSLMPTLGWSYPDAACVPEEYRVRLRQGPFFLDGMTENTGNSHTAWSPAEPLEPGTEYAWAVEAISGATRGPVGGFQYFFTGPLCSPASLVQPIPLAPEDDAIVADPASLALVWDYPDACVPDGYGVQLATGTDFDGSPWNGGTGNPSTRWAPGMPLTDCTRYFWRVVPVVGTTAGEYSAVRTFRVAMSEDCPVDGL